MCSKVFRFVLLALILVAVFVYPSAAQATGRLVLHEVDCNHIFMYGISDAYSVDVTVALMDTPDVPLTTLHVNPWKTAFWVLAYYSVPSYSSLVVTAREYTEAGKYIGQFSYSVSVVCPQPIIP